LNIRGSKDTADLQNGFLEKRKTFKKKGNRKKPTGTIKGRKKSGVPNYVSGVYPQVDWKDSGAMK